MAEENDVSPAEDRARSDGWVPLEEWSENGKDPDEWVDVREFNLRGELMGRIQSQSRQLNDTHKRVDDLTKVISELSEHNKKMSEVEYKKAMSDLKAAKKTALEDGEMDKVIEIDDHIDDLKEVKEATPVGPQVIDQTKASQAPAPQVLIDFLSSPEQEWYYKDPILRGSANAIYAEQEQAKPNATPQDLLDHTMTVLKKEFPAKFGLGDKRRPLTIDQEGSGRSNTSSTKYTERHLSEEQRTIGKRFVDAGACTMQKYVDDLAGMGELPTQQRGN